MLIYLSEQSSNVWTIQPITEEPRYQYTCYKFIQDHNSLIQKQG